MALYNVAPGTVQQIVWAAAALPTQQHVINDVLIFNRDPTNPIYIWCNRNDPTDVPSAQTVDNNLSSLITAFEQKTVSGSLNWWAIAPSTNNETVLVEATPGGLNAVVSPVESALQLITAGLATSSNQSTQITAANAANTALTTGIALPLNAAKETGGMLAGVTTGALVGVSGNTIGKEMAAWIAGGSVSSTPGGTPLLHGFDVLATFGTFGSVAASTATQIASLTIHKPGYIIAFALGMPAGTTVPFPELILSWQDGSGNQLAREKWILAADLTTATTIYGKGPTKGNTLVLIVDNLDPAEAVSFFWGVGETTQHIARDDFRAITSLSPTGFTAAAADPTAGILAYGNAVAIGAGTSTTLAMPLYCGQVNVSILLNQTGNVEIIAMDPALVTPPNGPIVYFSALVAATQVNAVTELPRCPCLIRITNSSGNAGAVTFSVDILEYAS